jgi:hypothetical protein
MEVNKRSLKTLAKAAIFGCLLSPEMILAEPQNGESPSDKSTVEIEAPHYIQGVNVWGRPGLLYGDSFERFPVGTFGASAHLVFEAIDNGSRFRMPVGFHYMAFSDLSLYAEGELQMLNLPGINATGLGRSTFGGKYGLQGADKELNFGLGCDVSVGPLSNSLRPSTTDFIPTGTVSYVFKNGMLANLAIGTYLPGSGWPIYVRLDAGLAYPLTESLTTLLEIGMHEMGGATNPGSFVAGGIRTNGSIRTQIWVGVRGSEPSPYFLLGGGLQLASL